MPRENFRKLISQAKVDGIINNLKVLGFPSTKMEVWSHIGDDSSAQIYEKFNEALRLLRKKESDTNEDMEKLEIAQTNSKINSALTAVPAYLEGNDTRLLFDNLWKLLKEVGFSEKQISSAWGIALSDTLDD